MGFPTDAVRWPGEDDAGNLKYFF